MKFKFTPNSPGLSPSQAWTSSWCHCKSFVSTGASGKLQVTLLPLHLTPLKPPQSHKELQEGGILAIKDFFALQPQKELMKTFTELTNFSWGLPIDGKLQDPMVANVFQKLLTWNNTLFTKAELVVVEVCHCHGWIQFGISLEKCNICYNHVPCSHTITQSRQSWHYVLIPLDHMSECSHTQLIPLILTSCATFLWCTLTPHVPTLMHSPCPGIMFIPLDTLYCFHSNPMLICFLSLYVSLCISYAHLSCCTPIIPNTFIRPDPIHHCI